METCDGSCGECRKKETWDMETFYEGKMRCIHRYFNGFLECLLAVFTVFEALHDVEDLFKAARGEVNDDFFVWLWTGRLLDLREGKGNVREEVIAFVKGCCGAEWEWNRIQKEAENEVKCICAQFGVYRMIQACLDMSRANVNGKIAVREKEKDERE